MTTASFDMTESIAPRSDQLNAEDLLTGPRTITITDVKHGTDEQPVNIVTAEFGTGRPYKPSKTMRRVLVAAWGPDAAKYIGRRLTVYRDPEVTFGKDKVGGIKISHMSHLEKRISVALTVTRGRRQPFTVDPLPDEPVAKPAAKTELPLTERIDKMLAAFEGIGVTEAQITARLAKPIAEWSAPDVEQMTVVYSAIKAGRSTVAAEFVSGVTPDQGTTLDEDAAMDAAREAEESTK